MKWIDMNDPFLKIESIENEKPIGRSCWSLTMSDGRDIWKKSVLYKRTKVFALLSIPVHLSIASLLSCSLIFFHFLSAQTTKTVRYSKLALVSILYRFSEKMSGSTESPFEDRLGHSLLAINGNFLFRRFYNALLNVMRSQWEDSLTTNSMKWFSRPIKFSHLHKLKTYHSPFT